MAAEYQNSSLWKAAFTKKGLSAGQKEARKKLIVNLRQIETSVADLLIRIPESCKGLTVHDIRHVHQLWEVASTICGPDYPINPLEGFVLGVAFLIHDAGLTAAAYPNGVEGLRQTQLYKDMLAIELKRNNNNLEITDEVISNASDNQKDRVLFAVLRKYHPERALQLSDMSYIEPLTKHSWTLLPVDVLLNVGQTIGRIAASHHWDISRVSREFREPLSPPAEFSGWAIDELKLACILRCADACAMDERRAPTMAFIIENPRGISREHWRFQANLNPAYLPAGQDAVVFQSKRPMKREDMATWWLAYEAVALADRELRDCARTLKSYAGQAGHAKEILLAAKRVEGAADAARLAELVTVDGWRPVDTAVRIRDPLALIERLGGIQLYGNDHTAPIRELVQNAADAIRARRSRSGYDPKKRDMAGKIQISIKKLESSDWVLSVIDDGIGMPEEVLAGPFLEFGSSLWNSDRLASLYPGLVSNGEFQPTGQFGIGFYSSFIIGRDIKVLSKPFNGGDAERKVLHFLDGIRTRAELRAYNETLDGPWPYDQSTIVEIRFSGDEWLTRFSRLSADQSLDHPIDSSNPRYWNYFTKTLEQLLFCLDVRVELSTPFLSEKNVNRVDIFEMSSSDFAQEFNRVFATSDINRIPENLIPLIQTMDNGAKSRTRGTVTISSHMHGIYHIGGLTVFSSEGRGPYGTRYVTGVHQAIPITAARQSLKLAASQQDFHKWAQHQLGQLDDLNLDNQQIGEALLAIHAITNELDKKVFFV